jgi:hypothetical protein
MHINLTDFGKASSETETACAGESDVQVQITIQCDWCPLDLYCTANPKPTDVRIVNLYILPKGCINISALLCCFIEVWEPGKNDCFCVNLRCKREVKRQTYSLSIAKLSLTITIDYPLAAMFYRLSCLSAASLFETISGVQLTPVYSSKLKFLLWSTIIWMKDGCLRFSLT